MSVFRVLAAVSAASLVAACDSPTPPTITPGDIAAAIAERNRVAALPATALADLPTGSVRYDGNVYSNAIIDGEIGYSILGDMAMNVNFAGGGVSGVVDNINLIDNGVPDQLLGGDLRISGATANGGISAVANGRIDAVGSDLPFRGASDIRLNMTGTVRDDGPGTAVYGNVTGGSIGDSDFDVTLIGGTFFGTD